MSASATGSSAPSSAGRPSRGSGSWRPSRSWASGSTNRTSTAALFVNASAEFGRADDPIHATAAEHKRLVQGYLADLARAAGAEAPEALAGELMMLMEGATVMAHVAGDKAAADKARKAAETLIGKALDAKAA